MDVEELQGRGGRSQEKNVVYIGRHSVVGAPLRTGQ